MLITQYRLIKSFISSPTFGCSSQWLPQRLTSLHLNLSLASSTVTTTMSTSPLNVSRKLPRGLPLFLLPGSSISNILYPMYSLSLLRTWPNNLNLVSKLYLQTAKLICSSDLRSSNPVDPDNS
ncbi:hypothetical protein AMECASPLE_039559 [Ameca splendens]|uniref:Uncharacterized protein n=1 Tax=Ameca splendens TaxID=208324 RepID=A0ABV0YW31_9TELE